MKLISSETEKILLAIEALYSWVGKREADVTEKCRNTASEWIQHGLDGYILAYHGTRDKMRTLFSGLIDFKVQEESKENGL